MQITESSHEEASFFIRTRFVFDLIIILDVFGETLQLRESVYCKKFNYGQGEGEGGADYVACCMTL